jgi:tRNA(adenine34) deaminase
MGSNWSPRDTEYMRAALVEATVAAVEGEVPVGAVVVIDDDIVATGYNREIIALRAAADERSNHRLTNATLYVTLEPCIMCVGAIAQARVGRVVFAAYDKKAGALGSVEDLSDSRALNHRFEINGGLLADESGALLKEFFEARRRQ